jgi:hypothetical protein
MSVPYIEIVMTVFDDVWGRDGLEQSGSRRCGDSRCTKDRERNRHAGLRADPTGERISQKRRRCDSANGAANKAGHQRRQIAVRAGRAVADFRRSACLLYLANG